MGRSCGHCCSCCGCSESIEQFSLKAGQTYSFNKYLVNTIVEGVLVRKHRCKIVKPANGYTVSTPCNDSEISDEDTSLCSTSCKSASKKWYLIETDSCTIWNSGLISCDGALIGIPDTFKYIANADTVNAPQVGACNMSANFELITCCSDPIKKRSIEDEELCRTSIKKPFCENCEGSRSVIGAKIFRYELDGTIKTPATNWNLCRYFNVVGVAPKLYTTFSHNYEGNCDLPCGPTESIPITNQLHTIGNPSVPFLRNYSRKWVITRIPPRSVNEAGDLCCPPVISGSIDEHGRLIPDMKANGRTMVPKPDTCSYCLDGSWHCNPGILLSIAGDINGPENNTNFMNLLSGKLRLTVDSEQNDTSGIQSPKFCCNYSHGPLVPDWRTAVGIFGWVPHSEIQEDGSRKIRFILERVPREDLWQQTYLSDIEIRYSIKYFGEDDLIKPTGAFFRLSLEIDTGFTVETLEVDSHRICPTTDGKIDCNFLNENSLLFNKIHRQSISIGRYLSSFGGSYDDVINANDIVPLMTASNCSMSSDSDNAEEGFCINPDDFDVPCNYRLVPEFFDYQTLPLNSDYNSILNKELGTSYTYALQVCCCDNQYIVNYNNDAITAYPNIGFPDPEKTGSIGRRCTCASFASGMLCSGAAGKRLAVIITDESDNVYTRDGCVCSRNTTFLADLAEFRAKSPNTDIIMVQPTIRGPGPCPEANNNAYFISSWLAGGCPMPEEVIGIVGAFPRSSHITTYDLLMFLYRYYTGATTGIGDTWYGHDPRLDPFKIYGAFFDQRSLDGRDPIDNIYTGMDIYRDISGSVTDIQYRIGVELFLNGGPNSAGFLLPSATEVFPTSTFSDSTFSNEAWLKYATLSKGGTKCLGIEDDGFCNRKVKLDPENTVN